MKSPLWSKILGVVLGICLGAGVTYAATYDYTVDVPSSVTVASEVIVDPGLQISPTTLDFGEVAPGQSTGPVTAQLTNIGDRGISLYFDVANLPEGSTLYYAVSIRNPYPLWYEVPHNDSVMLYSGASCELQFYLAASASMVDGPYSFTITIREGT